MDSTHLDTMKRIGIPKIIKALVAGVLIATLFAFLFGKLVQLLWNGTVAEIFNLNDITYLQGVGLLLLSRILVGGMGHPGRHHAQNFKDRWKCDGKKILEERARE